MVRPGDVVAAGDLLARLDPTMAEADLAALLAERDALTARIARLEAELDGTDLPQGDGHLSAEALVLAERRAEAQARRAPSPPISRPLPPRSRRKRPKGRALLTNWPPCARWN